MKTSVGITTIERNACLRRCLSSIERSDFNGSVIVADQNKRMPMFYNDFDIEVIDLDYDVGVSQARNEIVRMVDTDYLMLLEDDAVFNYDALKQLEKRMNQNKDYGWISPMIEELSIGRKIPHSAMWNITTEKVEQNFINREIEKFMEVDQASSIALYNTDVFNEAMWDKEVPVYRDHLIFAWVYKDTDWKAGVDPKALIAHSGCPNSPTYADMRKRKIDISDKIGGREVVSNR